MKEHKFNGTVMEIVYARRERSVTTVQGKSFVNFGLLEPARIILEIEDGDCPDVIAAMQELMGGVQHSIVFTPHECLERS